jgi:hypothetical protein
MRVRILPGAQNKNALVAQLDRAPDYESGGLRVRISPSAHMAEWWNGYTRMS